METTLELVPERKRSRAPLIYAAAALSCVAAILLWLYGHSSDSAAPKAAMGALQQAANVASPAELYPTQPVAPPDANGTPTALPQQPLAASAATGLTPSLSTPTRGATSRPEAARSVSTAEPGSAQALVDEGASLLQQGRLGLAESSYQKALRLQPDFPAAMAALVRVHLTRRDGAEAVRWAKRLAAKQPNGVNQLLLGDAYALYGDDDSARAAWELAAESGNATARQRLK